MHSTTTNSIIEILKKFQNDVEGIRFETFVNEMSLIRDKKEELSIHDVKELIKFSTEQIGYWNAEWSFSSATEPNHDAKAQRDGWENIWDNWVEILTMEIPEAMELMVQLRNRAYMLHTVKRNLEYNNRGVLNQLYTNFLSNVAITLNRIGFKSIATSLYNIALYPKGTVGRLN